MSQMRLNQLTGRWVTIVAERAQRPTDFAPRVRLDDVDSGRPCPFCPGNEESTPPALETIGEGGSWRVRVVPNLYPAFHGDEGFAVHHDGPVHVTAEGTGIHEVFVYTPDHHRSLDRLDDVESGRPCPFCPGNEESTPPALETIGEGGNWRVRVVPNLYPAFHGDDGFAVHHDGPVHVTAEGTGIHEVFVYTPDHHRSLDRLDDDAAGEFMVALKRRFLDHASTSHIRYTQAIVNHGREAGASLSHPHGQLLGLPFVPGEVLDEERAFARFAGHCLLCTTIEAELATGERVVAVNDDVAVICPYWSGSPYEMLIVPRHHELHLQDTDDASLQAVGRALRDATAFLNEAIGDVAYNVGFHTAPYAHQGEYHWHIHIWPNLVTQAGFERGTGVLINVKAPEQAAAELRRVAAPAGA